MLAERTGAPLTLSALAAEAQVSRRTLYVHWGTIQQVISDAITFHHNQHDVDPVGLSQRELLTLLLADVRNDVSDPASNIALSTMLSAASQSETAADVVRATGVAGYDEFVGRFAPLTMDEYSQLVGPILFAEFVLRQSVSDEFIEKLVDRGMEMVGTAALSAEVSVAVPALTA